MKVVYVHKDVNMYKHLFLQLAAFNNKNNNIPRLDESEAPNHDIIIKPTKYGA